MSTLYVMHHSTCARKALFVWLERGRPASVTSHEVERDFLRSPEYRRLNADGLVPTLVTDEGEPLVESSIIMRWLDDTCSGPSLQPTDPLQRARMNMWLKRVDEKFFPALQAITVATFMRRMFGVPPDEARLAVMLDAIPDLRLRTMRESTIRLGLDSPYTQDGLRELRAMLDTMESDLGDRAFLAGDSLSLADCAMTPLILRLEEFHLHDAWRERPHVAAWWRAMSARPTVRELIALADQTLLHELTGSVDAVRPQYLAALA